jgi:hypothetical protein
MFFKVPKALAAFGIPAEHLVPAVVEVWPENWPAWRLFDEMAGQWRVGFGGRYALDYSTLFARMDRMGLADDAWNELYADVRICEAAALTAMHPDAS